MLPAQFYHLVGALGSLSELTMKSPALITSVVNDCFIYDLNIFSFLSRGKQFLNSYHFKAKRKGVSTASALKPNSKLARTIKRMCWLTTWEKFSLVSGKTWSSCPGRSPRIAVCLCFILHRVIAVGPPQCCLQQPLTLPPGEQRALAPSGFMSLP